MRAFVLAWLKRAAAIGLTGFLVACATPATPTLEPTPAPTPTPTEVGCTAGERVYLAYIGSVSLEIAEVAAGLGALLAQVSADPAVLVDDGWRLRMGAQLGSIKVIVDDIRGTGAPDTMSHVQRDLLGIAAAMDEAASLYASGVDNLDADDITAANAAIGRATALSGPMTQKLQTLAC